jgi:hypothetical protein
MKIQFKLSLIALMCVVMAACTTGSLSAPCDQYAHFCGSKTKINQW